MRFEEYMEKQLGNHFFDANKLSQMAKLRASTERLIFDAPEMTNPSDLAKRISQAQQLPREQLLEGLEAKQAATRGGFGLFSQPKTNAKPEPENKPAPSNQPKK